MGEKNIFKHFVILGGGTALHLLLGLITTPLITRLVDPTEYGQLSVFTMYASIALIFFLLGTDQGVIRFYYESDSLDYKRALLFRCLRLPSIGLLVASIVIIALSATGLVEFEFSTSIMIWLCVYTAAQVYFRFSQNILRLEYNSKTYSMVNILQKLAYVVIAVPLLLLIKSNYLLILVIATVVAQLIALLISVIVQKDVWDIRKNKDSACIISMDDLMRYSLPLILSMGITSIFQAVDKMSLNYFCTYTEVGIYSSTMTLVNIFAILQTAFNTMWSPLAVEHYSKDQKDRTFYQKGNQVITVVMFFFGLCLILCKDVFAILLGEKYRKAAYILPFLIFHPIMYTISETTVTGITFKKKSSMQILIAGVSCLCNIIGNTILVPRLGCQGAAISTGLSYIVFFTMRTVISNKYFYVDFKLVRFYILTAAVCVYAFYNTFVKFNIGSVIGFAVCVVILVVLYHNTVKWCIDYGFKLIKKVLKHA